ncbi:6-O-methylguanine DNA methyltransferase [Paraphoma chrysanthemicola]|uniref:6-O-methylguanine DNA methyltransferase n=1 Tax=Paraphoma chrysanthemicola TaxID=798071 RepID=A0A8K0QTI9_9PLEO|nr:6-O-methylguanine DNA methyltransferase [Paraphoma chrysanthemicola]
MAPGERSEEVHLWYTAVYEAIPSGKVTSYGHIARLLGKPERPRQVGVCLKHLPSASTDRSKKSSTFHSGNVPWQRVINSKGGISPRGPSAASHQADALRREGVDIREDAMGQYTVDLAKYGWFPDVLPSEAGLVESSDEEDEEVAAYHT